MAEGVTTEESCAITGKLVNDAASLADGEVEKVLSSALLLVIGEPLNKRYIPALLDRINSGISSFTDDISGLLKLFSDPTIINGTSGDKVLEWKTDVASVQVLIFPRSKEVKKSVHQFLVNKTTRRSLLYAGHTVVGNGSWLLRDGSLSYADIAGVFQTVPSVFGETEVSTFAEGEWTDAHVSNWSKNNVFHLSREKKNGSGSKEVEEFVNSHIAPHIVTESVLEMLATSNVIGVVPFHRPTIYLFQGGDGMSAVFGVNGFSLLVEGGYAKHTSSWEFVRHLDRIDAMLISHLGVDNLLGLTSLFERYALGDVQTALGVVYSNIVSGSTSGKKTAEENGAKIATSNGKADSEPEFSLALCLKSVGHQIVDKICQMNIPLLPCTASTNQPINLYHKIGFGTLDMYVLNPSADSKDLKDFHANLSKHSRFSASDVNLGNQVSIAAVVVFKPAKHGEKTIRVLFPGSASQVKVFEGLDRLKNIPIFQTSDGLDKVPKPKVSENSAASSIDKAQSRIEKSRPSTSLGVTASVDKVPSGRPSTTGPTKTASGKSATLTGNSASSKPETKKAVMSTVDAAKTLPDKKTASTEAKKDARDAKDNKAGAGDLKKAGEAKDAKTVTADLRKSVEAKQVKPVELRKQRETKDVKAGGESKEAKTTTRPVAESKKPEATKESKSILPATSTPKKDSPRPAAIKVDPIRKNGSPAHGGETKKDESAKKGAPKISGMTANGKTPVIKKDAAKPAAEKNGLTEVVPGEVQIAVKKEEEPEIAGVTELNSVESVRPDDGGSVSIGNTAGHKEGGDSSVDTKPHIIAVDAIGDIHEKVNHPSNLQPIQDGEVVQSDEIAGVPSSDLDPIDGWEAPQSLPYPSDDKNSAVVESSAHPSVSVVGSSETAIQQVADGTQQGELNSAASDVGGEKPPTSAAANSNLKEASKSGSDTSRNVSAQNGKKTQPQSDKLAKAATQQTATTKTDSVKSAPARTTGSAGAKKPAAVKPVVPFYVDLAYVPVGASTSCNVDFFRRVRARRYVLPGAEVNCNTMAQLLEAKASWEGDVSVIPTGDVESLMDWIAAHRAELISLHVTVEPSVTSCTMSLQHATSCSAFRIEL